ncbi:hypothetical protein GGI07_002948 [Coemansia sp. Benny D115]|nr:hypothetical protein GGI07_002948 [Coemansia sp. Benny D115]
MSDDVRRGASYACCCLNVRVSVESTAESRSDLENIANVLECKLSAQSPIEVSLSTLVEVKPGSSVDRNINVLRCMLCKAPVLYFKAKRASSLSLLQLMPAEHSTGFLASETKDEEEIAKIQQEPEYSAAFGVLLLPEYSGGRGRTRLGGHVPREIQQKVAVYVQRQETEKNERVRDYIREQDRLLEQLQSRAVEESAVVADILSAVHPQSLAVSSIQRGPGAGAGAASGLAAMLRGSATVANDRPGAGGALDRRTAAAVADADVDGNGIGDGGEDDDDEDDEDDVFNGPPAFGALDPANSISARGLTSRRQHKQRYQSISEDEEDEDDGNSAGAEDYDAFNAEQPVGSFIPRPAMSLAAGHHHQKHPIQGAQHGARGGGGGNLGHVLAGSMPIQIPTLASGSLFGGHSLSRRELNQRADDNEHGRRREQIARDIPRTFVPPHMLMDQIHEDDADLFIGSKPRDSYGFGRRYAPG